ncbi:MAG: hypothetical protein ACHQSE_00630 [Gemmatimonadales bacterium]
MNIRLLSYIRYQVPDFFLHRLSLPLILVAFVAGLPAYLMVSHAPAGWLQSPQGINQARQMFEQSITLYLPLGAFVAAVGLSSGDRQQGHFRFLFSKPVNVPAYYAQAYLVNAIVYVAVFGVMVWAYGAYTIHVSVHRSMEAALLTFILIGGIGLLLGAVTRFDALALVAVYVVALILQQLMASRAGVVNGGLPAWLAFVGRVLPPVTALDALRTQLYAGAALDAAQLWHVLGYGGGAALVGFILLRRLPLAR